MAASKTSYPRLATLALGGWHGLSSHEVLVVGETPTRYRIRALTQTRLAGRYRYLEPTLETLVPRRVVSFLDKPWFLCALCGGSGRLKGPAIPPVVGLNDPIGTKGDKCWDCEGFGGWPQGAVDVYVSAGDPV
jgi:hypothetical protein